MSYQPPGPYPVFPQQYAPPGKPPIPPTVQRAFVLMLVGAGLEVVNLVVQLLLSAKVQHQIRMDIDAGTAASGSSYNGASITFGAVIGIGLWLWMAFANRGGAHWARVTGTVFFGISCLSLVADLILSALIWHWIGPIALVIFAVTIASWLVGLFTVILLWRKQSGAYFQPQYGMPPYPVPGYGPAGYAAPGYPGAPMGAPMQPQDPSVPQQPGDPWNTIPGGGS
jgi:hypothetical protein